MKERSISVLCGELIACKSGGIRVEGSTVICEATASLEDTAADIGEIGCIEYNAVEAAVLKLETAVPLISGGKALGIRA